MSVPAMNLQTERTLSALLQDVAVAPDVPLAGITDDSRKVAPGFAFLACQGRTSHGIDYLDDVIRRGAAAVVVDASTAAAVSADIPVIEVADLRSRFGELANRWYDFPSRAVAVTAVTGTNGKTTVAWLIRQCLQKLGASCGYVGTLGHGLVDIDDADAMTTPPCLELHEIIAGFRAAGGTHAAIEVSSHALDQARVDGFAFAAAVFTNLTRDHIDYHGGMRAYFEAKTSLFLDFDVGNRVVNIDSDFGQELATRCGPNVVTVSTRFDRVANGRPHVFVRSIVQRPAGSTVSIISSWGSAELNLPMPGEFNVANAIQVLAVLLGNDVPLQDAVAVLESANAPPGRMQPVHAADAAGPAVYVDYSHTPASLEAALKALRAHCNGKLWCVFGCGGDRDRGKRAMMGKIAARLADVPVVTSDNPRTEDPAAIIADVLEGMGEDVLQFVDRREAIAHAVQNAAADDVVLIAGKGHETYQVIGERTLSFSDVEVAREYLAIGAEAGGA